MGFPGTTGDRPHRRRGRRPRVGRGVRSNREPGMRGRSGCRARRSTSWTVISPPPSPSRYVRLPVPPGPGTGRERAHASTVTSCRAGPAADRIRGMAITGVLFDFSGTLMRIESPEEWLRGGLAELGAGPELCRTATSGRRPHVWHGWAPSRAGPRRCGSRTTSRRSGTTATAAPASTARRTPACPARWSSPLRHCTTSSTSGT